MHGVCAQAKDKLKKVKKASSELCDGVAEIKVSATLQKRLTTVHSISMCSGNVSRQALLQDCVAKISAKGPDQDISAAMTLLRKCVSICDQNAKLSAEFESSSSSKSKSKK